jgi:hypothetical protein
MYTNVTYMVLGILSKSLSVCACFDLCRMIFNLMYIR